MELALSCVYCGYVFDDEKICPLCGAPRQEVTPEQVAYELEQSLDQGTRRKVVQLLKKKRKVDAIRVYREATGSSLGEAKKAVDKIQKDLGL